jgi:excisionase family DNA binding protein
VIAECNWPEAIGKDPQPFGSWGRVDMRALKSIEEAAGLLGLSKWTVRAYIRDGKLQPVRLGRRVLLTEEELERLVTESKMRDSAQTEAKEMK